MAKKPKSKPINLAQFNRDSLVTRTDAIRLVAQTLRRADETDSGAYDRVRQLFKYAAKIGKLPELNSDKFVFGELAAWAQDKWGRFGDWPAIRNTEGVVSSTLEGVLGEMRGAQLPPDLPQCHQRIEALTAEVAVLHRANAALHREVVELRPYKIRSEGISQKNSESAKKRRGSRTK